MTHFPVIVLVSDTEDDPVQVASVLLAPYDEHGEWFAEESRWDWWQVGGRWTGSLCSDYSPEEDPRNWEFCDLCNGTGNRPDALEIFGIQWVRQTNGCNGCLGKGVRLKWSTQWVPFERDILPVKDMGEFLPHAIVTPDGTWWEPERLGWFGETIEEENSIGFQAWPRRAAELLLKHRDSIAVLVDCHV